MGPIERELRDCEWRYYHTAWRASDEAFAVIFDAAEQLMGPACGAVMAVYNAGMQAELFSEAIEAAEALGL